MASALEFIKGAFTLTSCIGCARCVLSTVLEKQGRRSSRAERELGGVEMEACVAWNHSDASSQPEYILGSCCQAQGEYDSLG